MILGEEHMKLNTIVKKPGLLFFLCFLGASTAILLVPRIWYEMSESEAQKQALNIPSWSPLVKRAQPAVAVIYTKATVEKPVFGYFVTPETQNGQGSGFLINEDGYIITNQHVIDGAQEISVKVGEDRREYPAKVIGSDEELDIALIKIESKTKSAAKKKWPFLPLGDSEKTELGDPVMVIGNPLGFIMSVNVGIISGKQRGGLRPSGRELFVELMQLQVPINPGNSGGPVLNARGEAIAVAESMSNAQVIGFGVPINIVKAMIPQLLKNGRIEKAFLGVESTDLTPQNAEALGLDPDEKGVVIVQVIPESAAEKAGLRSGDVILEMDGKKIGDYYNLRQETAYKGVGNIVSIKLFRMGEGNKLIKVALESRPDQNRTSQVRPQYDESVLIESVGLEVLDTPKELRTSLGLSAKNPGALVLNVAPTSPADLVGIAPRDVIVKINNTAISSALELKKTIDAAPVHSKMQVFTRRGKATRFLLLEKR
jgi:serine protease Do